MGCQRVRSNSLEDVVRSFEGAMPDNLQQIKVQAAKPTIMENVRKWLGFKESTPLVEQHPSRQATLSRISTRPTLIHPPVLSAAEQRAQGLYWYTIAEREKMPVIERSIDTLSLGHGAGRRDIRMETVTRLGPDGKPHYYFGTKPERIIDPKERRVLSEFHESRGLTNAKIEPYSFASPDGLPDGI